MLISASPKSPHHFSLKFHGRVRVFLNGQEAKRVTEADDEAGYIVQNRVDADGHRVVDLTRNQVVSDRIEGVVTFEGVRRGDL